ncbi:hypothetical protein REC_30 [Pseudomonas phage REC]|nr:hypothetical protein REC_30 [Pseudomonas phage REC]UGL62626.1 hypothetical protein [Pseudomonas phage REC1]
MTIKMRLDTEGLRALIAANPELEVEIGKEVVNNIRSDVVQKNVDEAVKRAVEGMLKDNGYWANPRYTVKDPKMLQAVDVVVKAAIETSLDKALAERVATMVSRAMDTEQARVRSELKGILQGMLTPEMARELLIMALNK